MKIAWFTPFSVKSAIGKYSRIVTEELAKTHEVHLWVADTDERLTTSLKVIPFSDELEYGDTLSGYDYCVYNLGNYLEFHKKIFNLSQRHPGIVILHDFVMHHFFAGYYFGQGEAQYLKDMAFYYGESASRIGLESMKFRRTPIWETDEVIQYPLFEKAMAGAKGVVVHSRFFCSHVKESFLGPVGVVYLPAPLNNDILKKTALSRQALDVPGDRLMMLTLGHVNPNKCIDQTLMALGQNPSLAKKLTYVVIGPHVHAPYSAKLNKLVKKYKLQNTVRFLGYQNDEALYAYMRNTDIFMNLRFPAIEGASWSLVEQLYFGKATIVSNTGCYSELPDECVVKVEPAHGWQGVGGALQRVVEEAHYRESLGDQALHFAREQFNVTKYQNDFNDFLLEMDRKKPELQLVDRVGRELSAMHVLPNMEICAIITQKMSTLLGDE